MDSSVKNALILAAGRGKRLMPYTADRPKCLVEVGGKPILYYQLKALEKYGIVDITIVIGYLEDKIQEYARAHFPRLSFNFIKNDLYSTTNDIYSFYLAKDICGGDFIQVDADLLFHSGILNSVLSAPVDVSVTYIRKALCGEEEMKVIMDKKAFVRKIGKAIQPEYAHGEFMGISLFRDPFSVRLFEVMGEIIQNGGETRYSGEAMSNVCEEGAPLFAIDAAFPVIEIDFPEDLEAARNLVFPLIEESYDYGKAN